ncbi:MAG: hypothetical protein KAG18_03905 [Sinobacterium sp.]|nr:hypothetical protein [Sinobacterium sp.]
MMNTMMNTQPPKHAQINSLLNLLAEQLEISVEMSAKDFSKISEFCLTNLDSVDDLEAYRSELITALQYYDRFTQCSEHIILSLRNLADELTTQHAGSIDIDFSDEIRKIHSLFNQEQADMICKHLHLDSEKEQALLENHWKNTTLSSNNDIDFF